MNMPFYVAPEQVMKDRADYARKGIARGRSLAAVVFADGILICAENPSTTLRKISEIYDRIAFAGVGKYNEFDQLRIAGVRSADLKGYAYSREDVEARGLANQYAQILGQIYDGTVMDEENFTVLGGEAEAIATRLSETWSPGMDLAAAVAGATNALAGEERELTPADLEVAVLARTNGRRAFRRIDRSEIADLLSSA